MTKAKVAGRQELLARLSAIEIGLERHYAAVAKAEKALIDLPDGAIWLRRQHKDDIGMHEKAIQDYLIDKEEIEADLREKEGKR